MRGIASARCAILLLLLALLPVLLLSGRAGAEPLRIGLAAAPTSLDPHHHNFAPNLTVALHVFEPLIARDGQDRPVPALAQRWAEAAPKQWQIALRANAVFHDGQAVTTRDVIYSFCRAQAAAGSPLTFAGLLRPIEVFEAAGPGLLRMTIRQRFVIPPRALSSIMIVPAPPSFPDAVYRNGGCAGRDGQALAIASGPVPTRGSGPYRFAGAVPGTDLLLETADRRARWSHVAFRVIDDPIRRMRALIDGEIDVAEQVPTNSIDALRKADIGIVSAPANRLIHLQMEQQRDHLADIGGTAGRNPFKDARVRQAISLAIDREALVERIMGGFATPVRQLVRADMDGYVPELSGDGYDIAAARALLDAAGYGGGFSVRLVTPDGRYANDRRIAEAVAAMLFPLGLQVTVEAVPPATLFTSERRDSAAFVLAGNAISVVSTAIRALALTPDRGRNSGTSNHGGYSNPAIDALYDRSIAEPDPERQIALLREANRLASRDAAVIPLFYGSTVWALQRRLAMTPRVDQFTLAAGIAAR